MFSFGSNAPKPATTTTGFGGSLFGSNTTQTAPAAPATTGGLFGAPNTAGQSTAPATTTTTGGLFGSTQPAAGTSTTIGGGLFGAQQPAANTTTTGGLFGAQPASTTTATGTSGGFFGTQPAASTTGGGLFGAQTGVNTTGSSFGFGAPSATTAPAQPAVQASGPFTRTTKFNDLPDAQKKIFEELESFIQGRVQISVELKALKLGEDIAKEQESLDELNRCLSTATSTLSSDRLAADDQRTKTDRNLQDALIATRIIDGFTKPQQMGGYLTSYANFPLEYFTRQVEEMKERVQRYKSTMEQIERKLAQIHESHQPAQPSPQVIANTLRAQHASFMALAARTAEIDAVVQKHKAMYTTRWRAQTGSARDPFAPASQEDDTLDALMNMSVSVAGR